MRKLIIGKEDADQENAGWKVADWEEKWMIQNQILPRDILVLMIFLKSNQALNASTANLESRKNTQVKRV